MKRKLFVFVALTILCAFNSELSTARAQGTAFTYQGQLVNNGFPANGNYDFTFALFNNSSTNTGQVGSTLTNLDVGVTNGLFATTLNFGAVFTGNATWLSIAVRTNGGGSFTPLNPLQALTPTPYAIYAPNAGAAASANSVAGSNIVGNISFTSLPTNVITNGASGVNITGTFTGNGAGVTNVTASTLAIPPGMALIPPVRSRWGTSGWRERCHPHQHNGVGVLHGREPGELTVNGSRSIITPRATAMVLTMPVLARRRIIRCRRWIGMTA